VTHTPILCLSPLHRPDPALVAAAERAGAIGCLHLGYDADLARAALRRLESLGRPFAVCVPDGAAVPSLSPLVHTLVLPAGTPFEPHSARQILVQVRSLQEAHAAAQAGASALIAKGSEAGGRVGTVSAFILLQQLLAAVDLPVWVQGGIGEHTAAAAIAGGAHGLVLDVQLALLDDCSLPEPVRELVAHADGSDTVVLNGYRVLHRPGHDPAPLAAGLPAVLGAGPLDTHLLPFGQDAALAAPLAARFRDVGGLVRGLRSAVARHLQLADQLQPLAPGHGVAASHGIELPVVQGPMTRVSDTAAFAEAVAVGGGLPFLALSLLSGAPLRTLLRETHERLGARCWGAGILGFAPTELRAEQLTALLETRPPVVLIAGGRPSQARQLEAEGIPAYLHVPSPGLLDLFWQDGVRRFVFEGRECGGHVGPRSSFVLWEQQLTRLLLHADLSELHVLFAGGVHDARSAAMVAALAAPLVERGARIGVLMGTAYLFTEEAVRSGAIGQVFHEAAIAADETVTVQTAPGHATRCVRSPFVDAFEARAAELHQAGVPAHDAWAELEQLNLGRLRIAAKGTERTADGLVVVSPERQRQEGMFMIGQAATLRSSPTTVRALHTEVTTGATAWLRERRELHDPTARPGPVDVAIIGMAGMFPGAPDLASFWSHLLAGHDAVTEVPRERWDPEVYYDPEPRGGDRSRSRWGGFLPEIPFDPLTFGIPPRSLAAIEPVQLLALQAAAHALADAGYDRRPFDRDRTSVVFGAEAGTDLASAYGFRALWPAYVGELPAALDAALPRLTEDSFPGVLANVIAGRIANRLDLGGVNYTVDAACASSLAALDHACTELRNGSSDLALCGGADLHNAIGDYLLFSSTHALSPTGRCATFDESADGIALGEAVAVVVLKRLEDAERDGDRIYAVVKAVAGASDGRSLGLTAPRKQGQVRAMQRAWARAGVDPSDVGLVEAHGTGTVVGDRTELQSLTDLFSGVAPGSVTLGSVKSQIGHTKCAAGLTGLIKTALAMHHRVLPPTLHLKQPNSAWQPESSPFQFRATPAPWVSPKRLAGLSAFGFGGTNFHAVLAPHDTPPAAGADHWPAELIVVRDLSDLPLLRAWLTSPHPPRLRDLARTLALRSTAPIELAIVATDPTDLLACLEAHAAGRTHPRVHRRDPLAGRTAWLFPGQGSQRPGMLAELFVHFPHLQQHLEPGAHLVDRLFPPTAFDATHRAAQRDALTDTLAAQPALGMVELAAAAWLTGLGLRPDALAGHSYGEIAALTVAGALPADQLVAISEARAAAVLAAAGSSPGTMLAVSAGPDALAPLLAAHPRVVLANLNAPDQSVLAGPTDAIAAVEAAAAALSLATRRFPVACAFHSPVVAGAAARFAEALAQVPISAPSAPVYANLTAAPHAHDDVRTTLAAHLVGPVRWVELVEAMYRDGVRTFVEVGPGAVLSKLVDRVLGPRPHRVVPLQAEPDGGLTGLLTALAALAAAGAPVQVDALFDGRDARLLALHGPPTALSPTTWLVNGHRARPLHGEPPEYALKVLTGPVALKLTAPTEDPREQAIVSYLENMQQLAEAQRQVMLGFLGAAPAPLPARRPAEAVLVVDAEELPPAPAPADPGAALLLIVSERTGYPADMLDLDLDLEADLSIDSIKRIEILGALSTQLGLGAGSTGDRDELIEQLSRVKTLRGILQWLAGHQPAPQLAKEPAQQLAAAPLAITETPSLTPPRTLRFVQHEVPSPHPQPGAPLGGLRLAVIGAPSPLADALRTAAEARGATASLLPLGAPLHDHDAAIWLHALEPHETPSAPLLHLLDLARGLLDRPLPVLVLTQQGGLTAAGADPALAGGVAGFVRALAHELPTAPLRRVDLDPERTAQEHARQALDELHLPAPIEVGYRGGQRHTLAVRPEPTTTRREPALREGDVLLVTGGARGITARLTLALAERYRPTLELVGRSPTPGPADATLAEALTEPDLRRLALTTGRASTPAEANRLAQRELNDRAMRETFAALDALGATWRYHHLDVRDPAAFSALLQQLRAEHGRLDAVVHGAGVTEDKLLRDKDPASFLRVYETKVQSALTLLDHLGPHTRLAVFFSSIAAAFGNRGQCDYAAANATLDQLARQLDARIEGRALSIAWGPWAGGGMVSAALEREYDRKGIGLIDPTDGVQALLDELDAGTGAHAILMRAHPEQLHPQA
jgi:acyl transferase domain-containing protein/NAD(P)H-dependent flavin oxidoreductase YrpB (nitropropane dioxygenase family)/NAD(P)-dependent dehydrogenase (short-subunit alcohol dehydrogenase family)